MASPDSDKVVKEQEMGDSWSANSSPKAAVPDFDPNFNPENPDNKFHPFSKLPAELRVLIWREARPPPRIINMEPYYEEEEEEQSRLSPVTNTTPAILHVNRESRQEGKRFYQEFTYETRGNAATTAYIDPSHDYIYMASTLDYVTKLENTSLWPQFTEKLIMDVFWWGISARPFHHMSQIFPNAKEMTLINYTPYFGKGVDMSKAHLIPCSALEIRTLNGRDGLEIVELFVQRKTAFPDVKLPILKFAEMCFDY